MASNHELPLTACPPSFAFISLHDLAGRVGMEPSCSDEGKKKQQQHNRLALLKSQITHIYNH